MKWWIMVYEFLAKKRQNYTYYIGIYDSYFAKTEVRQTFAGLSRIANQDYQLRDDALFFSFTLTHLSVSKSHNLIYNLLQNITFF